MFIQSEVWDLPGGCFRQPSGQVKPELNEVQPSICSKNRRNVQENIELVPGVRELQVTFTEGIFYLFILPAGDNLPPHHHNIPNPVIASNLSLRGMRSMTWVHSLPVGGNLPLCYLKSPHPVIMTICH